MAKRSQQIGVGFGLNASGITVVSNVFIGTNSTIVGGVRIGPKAIVAAGAMTKAVIHAKSPGILAGGEAARRVFELLDESVARQ